MTSTTPAQPGLPPPLVRLVRHPLRWVRIKVVLVIDAVVLAHFGVLIVAALYYLLTQTNPTVKHWWDTTVTPASLRHDIRNVGEGVLASCLAQAIVWNPFTRAHRRTGQLFARVRARYHLPVTLVAVVSAVIVGAAAFAVGELVLHALAVHATAHSPRGSIWHRTANLWTSGWDKKALGFAAAVVARRPLHVLFDRTQAYFAGRRAAAGRPPRRYHPPVFVARYNYLVANRHEVRVYPRPLEMLMTLLFVVSVALAGFGYYVLTYKA